MIPTGSDRQASVKAKAVKVATRAEKSTYRYSDFYCFMTLADFTAYIAVDDVDGDGGVSISRRYDSAA